MWSDRHLALDLARATLGTPQRPFKLTLILTEKCHLRCAMCRLWEGRPSTGPSLAELTEVFARNPWFSWINLSGGELVARSDLDRVLDAMVHHERRLSVLDFPTAGQDPEATERLVRGVLARGVPRLFVTVSIDGPRALHDEIRGVDGAYDRALVTLRRLRALRSRRLRVCPGITVSARNAGSVEATVRALQEDVPGLEPREIHLNLAHHSPHYYRNDPSVVPEREAALAALAALPVGRDPLGLLQRLYRRLARGYVRRGHAALPCRATTVSIYVGADLRVHACSTW